MLNNLVVDLLLFLLFLTTWRTAHNVFYLGRDLSAMRQTLERIAANLEGGGNK